MQYSNEITQLINLEIDNWHKLPFQFLGKITRPCSMLNMISAIDIKRFKQMHVMLKMKG